MKFLLISILSILNFNQSYGFITSNIHTNTLFKKTRILGRKMCKVIRTGFLLNTINEVASLTTNVNILDNVNHRVLEKLKVIDEVEFPNQILDKTKGNIECGKELAYSQFIEHIKNNDFLSVSIDQTSKFAIAYDKLHQTPTTLDLHYVKLLPAHISELINLMVAYDLDFNIVNF
jgi:hypothetical protein